MNLVFLVCLISAPGVCREERLLISVQPIAPIACLAGAPVTIAEWTEEHPEHTVSRWKCEPIEQGARR